MYAKSVLSLSLSIFCTVIMQEALSQNVFSDGTSYGWGTRSAESTSPVYYGSTKIDEGIKSIQSSNDVKDIVNTHSALKSASRSMIAQREEAIRREVYRHLGVSDLELQVENDRLADEDFYARNGQPYQGPTDESLITLKMLENAKVRADQQIITEISNDPEIREINLRQITLDEVSQKRISEILNR